MKGFENYFSFGTIVRGLKRKRNHLDRSRGLAELPVPTEYIERILGCILDFHIENSSIMFNLCSKGDLNPDSNRLSLLVETGSHHKLIYVKYPIYKEDYMRDPEYVKTECVCVGEVLRNNPKGTKVNVFKSNVSSLRHEYLRVPKRYFDTNKHLDEIKEFISDYDFEIMLRVLTVLDKYNSQ